jgi:hypothetical protein
MQRTRSALAVVSLGLAFAPSQMLAQTKSYALESADGLRLHNVVAAPATLAGGKGLRLTLAPSAAGQDVEQLALLDGPAFGNGLIEAEIAGEPGPGAPGGARGFVGIAFRVQADLKTYDAFYLRPTNGRADDQERRNHATQYISHPDWPWDRLRKETPSRYESYVDIVPAAWTRVAIEVDGDKARLYVNGGKQPVLIVNDVKSGPSAKGAVALWLGPGTIAHFRSLTITLKPDNADSR